MTLSQQKNFELDSWKSNTLVCGIDEVGRGCLAGPVVVCALILKPHASHPLLRDSKKLSEKQRNKVFEWIRENAWFVTSQSNQHVVDRFNIYQATLHSMRQACSLLQSAYPRHYKQLSHILVDAMPLRLKIKGSHEIYSAPKGESWSQTIAAASIVAKVTRDSLISDMSKIFPAFSLGKHKGYATALHRSALLSHGKSFVHRTSFLTKIFAPKD